ncbi:MAG: putative glycosyltransferase [Chloroflexi bacterium OLB13]|nr:MAG: putative glycosyltransferase [Chloroflexi bacterium OLB13]
MFKRAFDVVASAGGLTVLSPLLLLVAILVKATSQGPVLYRATRVGRDGVLFTLLKFRSMVQNADKLGPGVTGADDARITPIGRFLRRTKLDELPQLINVLRGEMSIVGPRPEDPRYVALYTPEQREVLKVRPGITSPASVEYRSEAELLSGQDWETKYVNEVMPAKLAIDLQYVRNSSFWGDLSLILRTALAIIAR